MIKEYKAQRIEVNARYGKETRYCIISTKTGEILDDAQGYGYRTAQNAYAAFGYKHRDKSKDKAKAARMKRVKKWMDDHKDFVEDMCDMDFQIAKARYKGLDDCFDAKAVQSLLDYHNLKPEFTAGEILRAWGS